MLHDKDNTPSTPIEFTPSPACSSNDPGTEVGNVLVYGRESMQRIMPHHLNWMRTWQDIDDPRFNWKELFETREANLFGYCPRLSSMLYHLARGIVPTDRPDAQMIKILNRPLEGRVSSWKTFDIISYLHHIGKSSSAGKSILKSMSQTIEPTGFMTPLHWAVLLGEDWKTAVPDEWVASDQPTTTPFHFAVICNEQSMLQEMLEQNPSFLNVRNNEGQTLVHTAVLCGHLSILEMLIGLGADLDVTIKHDNPLRSAASIGDMAIISALLNHGARELLADGSSDGALKQAVSNGHPEVVKRFLSEGAAIGVANDYRWELELTPDNVLLGPGGNPKLYERIMLSLDLLFYAGFKIDTLTYELRSRCQHNQSIRSQLINPPEPPPQPQSGDLALTQMLEYEETSHPSLFNLLLIELDGELGANLFKPLPLGFDKFTGENYLAGDKPDWKRLEKDMELPTPTEPYGLNRQKNWLNALFADKSSTKATSYREYLQRSMQKKLEAEIDQLKQQNALLLKQLESARASAENRSPLQEPAMSSSTSSPSLSPFRQSLQFFRAMEQRAAPMESANRLTKSR